MCISIFTLINANCVEINEKMQKGSGRGEVRVAENRIRNEE
jgi:hypothetical protein